MSTPDNDEAIAEQERKRLIDAMDRYLTALDLRDISKVRAAPNLRFTENGCELALGAGLWRTIRGRQNSKHYFTDVKTGQVEYWTVVDEMGTERVFGVRLRIEGNLISEVETQVVRVGAVDVNPVNTAMVMNAPIPFHDVIPPSERVSREELMRTANIYFNAIEQSDGSLLRVSDSCVRLVNGIIDSNMEKSEIEKLDANQQHRALKVGDQMSAGNYAYIEGLRGRRFPIIDERRGLVLAHVMFDHPGDLSRSGGENPMPAPNSLLAFEVFKVRKGVLVEVWAIGQILPYGHTTGWPM